MDQDSCEKGYATTDALPESRCICQVRTVSLCSEAMLQSLVAAYADPVSLHQLSIGGYPQCSCRASGHHDLQPCKTGSHHDLQPRACCLAQHTCAAPYRPGCQHGKEKLHEAAVQLLCLHSCHQLGQACISD